MLKTASTGWSGTPSPPSLGMHTLGILIRHWLLHQLLIFFFLPSTVFSQVLKRRISPTISNFLKYLVVVSLVSPSSVGCRVRVELGLVGGVGIRVCLGRVGVLKHVLIVICPWISGLPFPLSDLADTNAFFLCAGVRSEWWLVMWLLSFFCALDLHPSIGHHFRTLL